jgi:hypothetical protein
MADASLDLLSLPWGTGGLGDLVVFAQAGGEAPWRVLLVGIMASPEIAAAAVAAHNAGLAVYPGTASLNAVIRAQLAAVERDGP